MAASGERFEALDGLRGLAALGVAVMHFAEFMPFRAGHAELFGLVHGNHLAVDFFFVLSGFVLAHATVDRMTTRHDVATFIIRRFGRLWPLHGAMLAVMMLGAGLCGLITGVARLPVPGIVQDGVATVSSALLLNGMIGRPGAPWNFPSWSISTEFWANVALAILVVATAQRAGRYAAVIAAVCLGWVYVAHPDNFLHPHFAPVRCLCGVFAGVAVYHVHRAIRFEMRMATLIEGVTAILALATLMFASPRHLAFVAPPVFAVVVFVFAREAGDLSQWLRNHRVQRWGQQSYSIYLVHVPLIALLFTFGAAWQGMGYGVPALFNAVTASPWWQDLIVLGYIAIVLAISSVTYRRIEEPARRYFNDHAARIGAQLAGAGLSSRAH